MKIHHFSTLILVVVLGTIFTSCTSTIITNTITQTQTIVETKTKTQSIVVAPISPQSTPNLSEHASFSLDVDKVTEIAEYVFNMTNHERISHGLQPLDKDSLLEELAIEHSINMARIEHFGHERYGWRDLTFGRLPGNIRGENIALVPAREFIPGPLLNSEEIAAWSIDAWLDSPGHRSNILYSSFKRTGLGVIEGLGYYYITQIFEG